MNTCTIIENDSRKALKAYQGQADLIFTSPPYADARKKHYDSVSPDEFATWFLTFHEVCWRSGKMVPSSSISRTKWLTKSVIATCGKPS